MIVTAAKLEVLKPLVVVVAAAGAVDVCVAIVVAVIIAEPKNVDFNRHSNCKNIPAKMMATLITMQNMFLANK